MGGTDATNGLGINSNIPSHFSTVRLNHLHGVVHSERDVLEMVEGKLVDVAVVHVDNWRLVAIDGVVERRHSRSKGNEVVRKAWLHRIADRIPCKIRVSMNFHKDLFGETRTQSAQVPSLREITTGNLRKQMNAHTILEFAIDIIGESGKCKWSTRDVADGESVNINRNVDCAEETRTSTVRSESVHAESKA